ncbi:MAG TPA: YebC/PmpR family DNA-binding transcriptional regulator [Planctomycetia bacterium]|nr:YebC/PmpR family DNA-binding transcriptional regulator [Planctomycetia bacterium]
MAGHSHAKNIKIRKAAVDSKRSKLFSKLARLVITAARDGADPRMNAKLAFAISKAKAVSLPKETIEKAIKKGSGEAGGDGFESVQYEGYGPGGVAVICDILTDNRNRTAGEIRKIFDVNGGKLGTTNCVGYMFQRKGRFLVEGAGKDEDAMMELAMEAGAEDLVAGTDCFEIICDPAAFAGVGAALAEKGIQPAEADIVQIAETDVAVQGEDAARVAKLLDALDDHDDVQNVFSNADLPEEN